MKDLKDFLEMTFVWLYEFQNFSFFDLHDIPLEDNRFDVIFCNHVMEHVDDPIQCMKELYRVMNHGGWGIMQVPQDFNRAVTYEDPTITSPEEREKHFWQYDHVRLFGRDYPDYLRKAGFEQTVGIEPYIGIIYDEVIAKVRYNYSHMRTLSQSKLNIGMIGYDPEYADVKISKPFEGAGFTILYDGWDFFYDDVTVAFKYESPLTYNQMLAMYMASPTTFDTSLQLANKGESNVNMVRYGFTKDSQDWLFGYEYINYHQVNRDIDSDKGNYAHSYYMAHYGIKNITPYAMHSWSQRYQNGKDIRNKTKENVAGFRMRVRDDLAVLLEYRETGWWQTETIKDYKGNRDYFADDDSSPIKMISTKIIFRY
jgi:ubiquinone/menaquinone biosynthesis C-methylase UbiE